jgi:hypothetical protein
MTDQMETMDVPTSPPKVGERIYIGGLNPPRLSGRDILGRLKSLNQIEIESSSIVDNANDGSETDDSDDDDNRPYLHVTVISKHDSDSALSIIHKQYHNVKWKGCKLVVEVAKPHFLERLEQERKAIAMAAAEKLARDAAEDQDSDASEAEAEAAQSRIPRRLRVRKKHGDTAVHVDTKPWTVESWSRFSKARSKLKNQEEKREANAIANSKLSNRERLPPPGPLLHRAVHIRFLAEDKSRENLNRKAIPSGNNNKNDGVTVSSSGSSSESSSSDSDTESEASDNSDNENSKEKINGNGKERNLLTARRLQPNNETYNWSTDEESSESDEESMKYSSLSRDHKALTPAKTSGIHEFSSGLDDPSTFGFNESTDQFGDHDISDRYDQGENEKKDLVGDVSANLDILSSIFPDMAVAKPVNPDIEGNSNTNIENENKTSSSQVKKNDHNRANVIMTRFDPTAESSRKYIVEDDVDTKQDEGNNSTENPDGDAMDEDKEKTQNETTTKSPLESSIYEQDKLENVFRDARDTWEEKVTPATMPSTSTETTKPDSSSGKSAFSFGFNVNDNDSGNADSGNAKNNNNNQEISGSNSAEKAFSFSFNVPDQDQPNGKEVSEINENSTTEQKDTKNVQTGVLSQNAKDSIAEDDGSVDEKVADDVVTRHKGLTLPDEDLQKYVDNFFGCNNGLRIMQNPQEFTNDEKDKVAWKSERQTLTLDWKRKRKYAITRIQKRMKVRRR